MNTSTSSSSTSINNNNNNNNNNNKRNNYSISLNISPKQHQQPILNLNNTTTTTVNNNDSNQEQQKDTKNVQLLKQSLEWQDESSDYNEEDDQGDDESSEYGSSTDQENDDDESFDFDSEEEIFERHHTYESDEEEEDDETDDESNSSESEEEDDDDESNSSESESEEEKKYRRNNLNFQSNFNLKKSTSSLLFKSSDDSTSESEEDSNSSGHEFYSDRDGVDCFEDFANFIPNYSISISPSKKNQKTPDITVTETNTATEDESDDCLIDAEEIKQQQEKDKLIINTIRNSMNGGIKNIKEANIPYWFGQEDESQLKIIFQTYLEFLQIDQEIKQTLRGPKPFIGRVHRRVIHYNNQGFTTLDTVKVYRWEIQPMGRPLALYKSFVLLTQWDQENGIPEKLQKVNSLSNKDYWAKESKDLKSASLGHSFIYCSPIFQSDFGFQYSVDLEKYPIDFLPCPKSNNVFLNNQLFTNTRRSSHPSLLLSSHIYSHSIIPQNEFRDKASNDYS